MALEDQVIARLKEVAPHLRTVEGSASLAALIQNNALSQAEAGLRAAQSAARTGSPTLIASMTGIPNPS